ncbi:hypothetical protein MBLNU459_g6279t1 [Dothideomycetes sp. NU459]
MSEKRLDVWRTANAHPLTITQVTTATSSQHDEKNFQNAQTIGAAEEREEGGQAQIRQQKQERQNEQSVQELQSEHMTGTLAQGGAQQVLRHEVGDKAGLRAQMNVARGTVHCKVLPEGIGEARTAHGAPPKMTVLQVATL